MSCLNQPIQRPIAVTFLLLFGAGIAQFTEGTIRADEPSRVQLVAANMPLPANGPFQVTIDVFEISGAKKQLQDRHLVVFHDRKAYDFGLMEPKDVTVIDPVNGEVTLLSRKDKVKATIANEYIVKAVAQLRLYAKQQGLEDRLGMNAAVGKANADQDADAQATYQADFSDFHYQLMAKVPAVAMQPSRFAEFTDWVARVNLIRKLGTPPFARMKLGRMVATDGMVPSQLTLTIQSGNHKREFLSNYAFKNTLSKESQERLDEAAGMMALYDEVPLTAFPR